MLDYIQTFPDLWEQSEGGAFRSCCNSLKFGGFIDEEKKRQKRYYMHTKKSITKDLIQKRNEKEERA